MHLDDGQRRVGDHAVPGGQDPAAPAGDLLEPRAVRMLAYPAVDELREHGLQHGLLVGFGAGRELHLEAELRGSAHGDTAVLMHVVGLLSVDRSWANHGPNVREPRRRSGAALAGLGRLDPAWLQAFVVARRRASPLLAYAGGLRVPSSNLGAPTEESPAQAGFFFSQSRTSYETGSPQGHRSRSKCPAGLGRPEPLPRLPGGAEKAAHGDAGDATRRPPRFSRNPVRRPARSSSGRRAPDEALDVRVEIGAQHDESPASGP